MIQISKRARAITQGRFPREGKLTGKTHAHQRAHRAKMHGTRAGWVEHVKRQQRRASETRRIRKQQRKEWIG